MEDFEPTLTKTEEKGSEKQYVYKVSVMPISGAAKPYKTLVNSFPKSAELIPAKPYKTYRLWRIFATTCQKGTRKQWKSIRFRRVPRCTSSLFEKDGKAFKFMVQIEFCAVVIWQKNALTGNRWTPTKTLSKLKVRHAIFVKSTQSAIQNLGKTCVKSIISHPLAPDAETLIKPVENQSFCRSPSGHNLPWARASTARAGHARAGPIIFPAC